MKILLWTICLLCVALPSASAARFICYYPSWAMYFPGTYNFPPSRINASLCTHLMYAFAIMDPNSYKIVQQDIGVDPQGYPNFVALKKKNPNLKTMISLGGGNDSNDGTKKYSKLVASSTKIATFVSSVMTFLQKYGFDGLDLDWECPTGAADKAGFVRLTKALRTAFNPKGYLLSAAVPADESQITSGYDLPSLNLTLDFINLMTYDMHGSWESTADNIAPLYQRPWDVTLHNTNYIIDYVVKFYINSGFAASKINLGIPAYGNAWTLSSSVTSPPAPASGPSKPGPIIKAPGTFGYLEICYNVLKSGWKVVQDPLGRNGPYAYSPDKAPNIQWVGYDDPAFAVVKSNYALSKGLGGAMVRDITRDDFVNQCGTGVNPLLTAISKVMLNNNPASTTVKPTTTTKHSG